MSRFKNWYVRNQDAITWFVIGLLVSSALEHLARGQYTGAMISIALAGVNYYFGRTRIT